MLSLLLLIINLTRVHSREEVLQGHFWLFEKQVKIITSRFVLTIIFLTSNHDNHEEPTETLAYFFFQEPLVYTFME